MIVHKTIASSADGLQFVLSDATVDRLGDIVEPAGWQLENFKKNPIALFGHRGDFPIGTWTDLQIKDAKLVARLKLAAKGTSARIDELISLVEQGILRAVSVGFRPLASEPIDKAEPFGGQRYTKQELVETSLCSVPANPAAMAIARSLNLSSETLSLAFGEHAETRRDNVPAIGKQAAPPVKLERPRAMSSLSKQIEDKQAKVLAMKDQLAEHTAKIAGNDADETDTVITTELTNKLEIEERSLASLQTAEKSLGWQSVEVVERIEGTRRPLSVAGPKLKPGELVMRALVAKLIAHAHGQKDAMPFLVQRYGSDGKVDEQTKAVFNIVTRTPTVPADTITSGWASQLVETQVAEFMSLLYPQSVYPSLSAKGLRLNFGRAGIVSIPSRVATPTIAGAFIAQGAPIPVKQGAFTSVPLSPKKLAVISTFTREIAEHSTPAIEGLIRDAMQEDTSVAIDAVLLSSTAVTAVAPAGIRAAPASATSATAGGGFAALVGDIKALLGALITSTNGNLRKPVWIMNPVQAIAASLTQNAGGDFPFASEINGNTLQGYPLIISSTVPAGMVILIDAADFVSIEGDAPKFDVSDQATLHMETAPLQIATGAQGSGVLATPTQSLWQTDTMAIRMIMDLNWTLRRTGIVQWITTVSW